MAYEKLLKRPQFLAVAASQRKWVRPAFVIQFLRHAPESDRTGQPPRFGFTVTKKQGNAVMRNRIRRRLREAARHALADIALPGCDYVIIGRHESLNTAFEALKADLALSVQKLHERF